jgi:hypothetical protein
VPLTDPVWQLSDYVRQNGPIVFADDAPQPAAGVALPRTVSDTPAGTSTVPADPASVTSESAALSAGDERPGGGWTGEQDAHVWHYLSATAQEREASLGLRRAARIEIQRRLTLMGYDTGGVDGVFGPRTRTAVDAWQRDFGFAATGHLDAAVIASIEERSEAQWAAWEAEQAARRLARRNAAPEVASAAPAARDNSGCLRDGDGRIVEFQSLVCDLKGAKEGIARFFGKLTSASATDAGRRPDLPPPGHER